MSRTSGALVAGLLLAACAPTLPFYWAKPGATERQFLKASRDCRFDALKNVGPVGQGVCTYVPGGQICREYDDFERAQLEDERERKLQRIYGACMQEHGWTSNHEGEGFRQNYGQEPEPDEDDDADESEDAPES